MSDTPRKRDSFLKPFNTLFSRPRPPAASSLSSEHNLNLPELGSGLEELGGSDSELRTPSRSNSRNQAIGGPLDNAIGSEDTPPILNEICESVETPVRSEWQESPHRLTEERSIRARKAISAFQGFTRLVLLMKPVLEAAPFAGGVVGVIEIIADAIELSSKSDEETEDTLSLILERLKIVEDALPETEDEHQSIREISQDFARFLIEQAKILANHVHKTSRLQRLVDGEGVIAVIRRLVTGIEQKTVTFQTSINLMIERNTRKIADELKRNSNQAQMHTERNDDLHKAVLSHIVEKMGSYIVKDALLHKDTHGEPSVCYQETREHLLDEILLWVQTDHTSHSEYILDVSNYTFCIEGAPGSGKSTIMNTMVTELLEEAQRRQPGLVTAHYMVRRRLQTTTDANKVFPTLMYQLATRSLEVSQKMKTALSSIPHTGILSKALQSRLFLETIQAFVDKVFLIVDALDESSNPELLAATLSPIIRQPPRNLRLLLATRNEHDVLASLGDDLIPKIIRSIPTKESYLEVGRFIATRLKNGVRVIFRSSPRWTDWPSVSQIDDLTERADGLYIWATTAVDFIVSQVKRRGVNDRDRWIEEVGRIGQGTKDVDALYLFILRNYIQDYEGHERCTVLSRMRGVLGFIVTAEHPLALDDMVAFLDFDNFDVHRFVEVVRSILVPGTDIITGSTAPQVHKTFSDFITSDRAAEFKVEPRDLHRIAASRCFLLMEAQLRFNICGLRSSFDLNKDNLVPSVPRGLIYACTSWWYHLKNTDSRHLRSSLRAIQTLLCENFLFWLEIVSVAGSTWEDPEYTMASWGGIPAPSEPLAARGWVSELGDHLALNCPTAEASNGVGLADFARDASDLLNKFGLCISLSIPHIYFSVLAFSPRDSIVAAHYRSRVATMVIPPPPNIPRHWKLWNNHPSVQTLYSSMEPISFSPCGHHLSTVLVYGSILVWDVETGEFTLGPLRGGSSHIITSCFSPDGLLIASGDGDGTICVWDSKTGDCIVGPLTDHTDTVWSVSFSPDSTRIASGSFDESIRVWDTRTGQCVLGPLKVHNDPVYCVAYSPNASCIASCSGGGTIRVWDAQSGECIFDESIDRPDSRTYSSRICFSPDGGRLASGSYNGTLRIWSTQSWTCIHEPVVGTGGISCYCFSPDGRYIVLNPARSSAIRIWDTEKAVYAAEPIVDAKQAVWGIVFSPNGRYLAVGSWYGQSRLWDFVSLLRAGRDEAGNGAQAGDTTTVIRDHTVAKHTGWTLGPQGERLFWVPEPFQSAIWRPSTIRIIGGPAMIKPDLTNLVTGEEWLQCFPSS